MHQVSAHPSRKFFLSALITSAGCMVVGAIACAGLAGMVFPAETRAPETFPDAEIVFLASNGVGFIDADGSNATYVPFVVKDFRGNNSDFWRPVMTGDNRTLITKVGDQFFNIYNPTPLVIWHSEELPILCKQWGPQQMAYLSADQQNIFIKTDQAISVYDLDDCGTENASIKTYHDITGAPSPNLRYIAYANQVSDSSGTYPYIAIRNMESGKEHSIGEGGYPAWSRDSQWLAYTGVDGIYVVNIAEGAEPRRVILYPNLFEKEYPTYKASAYWRIPPEVSWSPDGKWLVYHKWTGTDKNTGVEAYANSIYKVNVETGEETEIIDHGMYPYWRWPAQP